MSQKLKDEDKIKKRSLEEAVDLKKLTKGLGLHEAKEYICTNKKCQAHIVFDHAPKEPICAFCRGKLISIKDWNNDKENKSAKVLLAENYRPDQIISFKIAKKSASELLKKHLSNGPQKRFFPNDLTDGAKEENIYGIYLPIWLMEIKTRSTWEAESEFVFPGKDGNKDTQKQTTSGFLEKTHANNFVRDSKGMAKNFGKLGEYRWEGLVPFEPDFLKGWATEMYPRPLKKIFEEAEGRIDKRVEDEVGKKVIGNTFDKENLDIQTEKNSVKFRLVLVPAWIALYKKNKKKHFYYINGQTGNVGGEKPLDDRKVAIAMGALTLLILILIIVFRLLL